MSLFAITCTTCNTRLKVNDRKAIGQILSCPKCSSMVLVEVPEGVTLKETPTTATAEPEPSPSPVAEKPAEKPGVDQEAETVDDIRASNSQNHAGAVLPKEDWMSSSAQKMRRRLLGGGVLLGVVVVVVLMVWLGTRDNTTASAQRKPGANDASATTQEPTPPDADAQSNVPDSDAADNSDNNDAGNDSDNTNADADPDRDTQATESGDTDPMPPDDKGGPPGLVANDQADPADSTESALTKLENLIKGSADPPPPKVGTSELVGPADSDTQPRTADRPAGETIRAPTAPHVDVAAQMNLTIPGIEIDELPLVDFARFITSLTTIPITLDIDAMRRLQVALDAPVSVKQMDVNVKDLLAEACGPLGLVAREQGDQLLITAPDAEQMRQESYAIDDLVSRDADLGEAFLLRMQKFVAPPTWKPAGGTGTAVVTNLSLSVEQTEAVHFELAQWLGALRAAGSRDQNDATRRHLFAKTEAEFAPRLQEQVVANFLQPTPFVDVLQHLEKSTGLHMLVDWQALGKEGWFPAAPVTLRANDDPLAVALHRLLDARGLSYRFEDENTLQITTSAALAERDEIRLFDVKDLLSETTDERYLEQRVRATLTAPPASAVYCDTINRHLVVRVRHHQLATLNDLLAKWRD